MNQTDLNRPGYKGIQYITLWRMHWVVSEGRKSPYIAVHDGGSFRDKYYIDAINNFKTCVDLVKEHSNPLINADTSNYDFNIVSGSGSGAGVRLIYRETEVTIKKFELGVGWSLI